MRSGVVEGLQANGTHLRTLTVELLTGETILICIEGKTTCSAIWNRVQGELVARGVIHPQIFGLAIKTGFDWVFVDPDAKVSKYFAKDWKATTAGSSSSINETKTLVLYCRVHFYLESVPPNFDSVSLLHYYLQLRQNLTTTIRRHSTNLVQTLAYAFQAELGDWAQCQETPPWSHSLIPGVASTHASLTRGHQALSGLGQIGARTAFIRSLIPTYNMHLYGMNLRTKDGKDMQAWIGVTPKGIEVYQNELSRSEIPEQPRITFLWANITKLYFERKKFEIRGRACSCGGSSMEKLTFTSWSESVPRHLLLLCRSTHQFHLSNHKIFLPPTNGSGGGDYRTTSSTTSTGTGTSGTSTSNGGGGDGNATCSSTLLGSKNEDKMLDLSLWADGLLLPTGNESSDHQRVSVISNASSNTTSGIVSDRVYSLDGSEEDLEVRISDEFRTDRTNHSGTNNSTSLESLSHKPPKPHHLPLKPHHCNGIQRNHHGVRGALEHQGQEGSEADAKFWYCDSDCEDDDCDTGPSCRSLLVRTINNGADQKHSCAAFCECNSCLADEEDFERESSNGDSTSNQLPHHHNTPSLASEKTLKAVDISIEDQPLLDSSNKMERGDQEGPTENVYGKICEDPKLDLKGERQYSTIENEVIPPKPKPRCQDRDSKQVIESKNNRNDKNRSACKHKGNGSGNSTTVAAAKETSGVTPKVASLKYLRTQHVPPWNRTKCSKDANRKSCMGSLDETDGCYIEFDKTVHQGRYPSTRTVSDNFDTDSDYVQLPPLLPRRPPPKRPTTCNLWKFVKGGNAHHKSCGNVVEESSRKSPAMLPPSAVTTLPRRVPTDAGHQLDQLRRNLEKLSRSKAMSKSTNAINTILQEEERPPKPPSKPKKLSPGSELPVTPTQPVDARFITSKPEILIQTAYATPATIASPGQAQILFRGSQVPMMPTTPRRTQSQIVQPTIQHSQSMDNIYDTVASEEPTIISKIGRKQDPLPPLPPPLLPKPSASSSSSSIIIRPNNYIDVHASSPSRREKHQMVVGSNVKPKPNQTTSSLQPPQFSRKCPPPVVAPQSTGKTQYGSVPNNLHTFYMGLQNLKPLSRAPIVYPMATSCSTLNANGSGPAQPQHHKHRIATNQSQLASGNNTLPLNYSSASVGMNVAGASTTPTTGSLTTLYTSHLSRSQIQQFKAQLYSDMDYVIFPPKDPRLSQQEYSDSRSLSHTTKTSTNSTPILSNSANNAFSMNDILPPYLPPPPPYPHDPNTASTLTPGKVRKPPRPLPGIPVSSVYSPSKAAGLSHQPNSFTSLYTAAMSSNASQCSSSQYGAYAMGTPSTLGSASTVGLNAENLQKFLSTQSLTGSSHLYSPPPAIYYPASTHSAPPLPPYKTSNQVLIENGMRKAVQRLIAKTSLSSSDDRIRMKLLSRSEESLYSQPVQESEEKLQAIYNLPPPPPYKKKPAVPLPQSEVDLTSIRQKCTALELPLLRALLNSSDGALITNQDKAKAPQPYPWIEAEVVNKTPQPPARPPKPVKQYHQQTPA